MSLRANVSMLIRPHLAYDATGKLGIAQALLTQLTQAESGRGKPTTNERPVPIHLTAIALWQDLEFEAREHQYQRTSDDSGGLWQIVSTWETIEDDEWASHLEHVTADWITRITNVIHPTRPRRPLMRPCEACGEKYQIGDEGKRIPAVTAWCWDEHGEQVARVDDWDVQCSACGAEWRGKEVARVWWQAVA